MRKVAFFSLTPSPPAPPANHMTFEALRAAFPEFQFEQIFILPQLKQSPLAFASSALVAGVTYAPDLLRGRKSFKYSFFRTPWIFRWVKRRAAQLVNTSEYAFSFQMQSLFDASVPGLPHFVYTDHTHLENLQFADFPQQNLYSRHWIECERSIYHNAAAVFTRSSNVSASLVSRYDCDAGRIECVYAGSNATVPKVEAADRCGPAGKNILFAGVDWDRKGGPTLLAAFGRVLERHPDATLTIVGCSPDIKGTSRCNVVGRVPLDDMPSYFADASVFCLPTRVEPFGIVFVEAMWHGLPIVATKVGAVPDMVEEGRNGFLVTPGDVDALADKLTYVLDNPRRSSAFGAKSRQIAEDRYDWSKVADRMRQRIRESY